MTLEEKIEEYLNKLYLKDMGIRNPVKKGILFGIELGEEKTKNICEWKTDIEDTLNDYENGKYDNNEHQFVVDAFTIMSRTLSEFYTRTVSTYINGEHLTYADICDRMYKLVEDNYGKYKDGHFGFSMKEYKRLTENDIYDNYYTIVDFYRRYLDRMKYYKNNLERIKGKKYDSKRIF